MQKRTSNGSDELHLHWLLVFESEASVICFPQLRMGKRSCELRRCGSRIAPPSDPSECPLSFPVAAAESLYAFDPSICAVAEEKSLRLSNVFKFPPLRKENHFVVAEMEMLPTSNVAEGENPRRFGWGKASAVADAGRLSISNPFKLSTSNLWKA